MENIKKRMRKVKVRVESTGRKVSRMNYEGIEKVINTTKKEKSRTVKRT